MIAVADTSGLLAAFNRTDREHAAAVAAADACGLLVVSGMTITELHQVASIRADRRTADAIVGMVADRAEATRVTLAGIDSRLLKTALAVRGRYADLDVDLADAVTVALAAQYRTNVLLTPGRRDFRAMRPLTGHDAFRLLPDDL